MNSLKYNAFKIDGSFPITRETLEFQGHYGTPTGENKINSFINLGYFKEY